MVDETTVYAFCIGLGVGAFVMCCCCKCFFK